MNIEIVLNPDRTRPGTLKVFDDDGVLVLGPLPCLGRADNAEAAKHGNPTRSPLRPFGDTPTGKWRVYQYIAPSSETASQRTYGPHGALDLWPTDGPAVTAYANGRRGILIHGGAPSASGGLRPTHGCVRVANSTILELLTRALAELQRGIQPTATIVERDAVARAGAFETMAAAGFDTRGFANGDEAMRYALARGTSAWVLHAGTGYRVEPWGGSPPAPALVVDLDVDAEAVCVVCAGGPVYARSSAETPRRWLAVPDARAFMALSDARQRRHRRPLVEKLHTYLQARPDELVSVATVELAMRVAREASRVYPVTPVDQPGDQYRGGQTRGSTIPIALWPAQEPRCYLPVISEVEGRLESINAYDLGAGISLGPIQINAQRGAILRFLLALQEGDPWLWERLFGQVGWSAERHGNALALRTPAGLLDTEKAMIAYLQSGNPSTPSFAAIDAGFRLRLAGLFAQALAWPHVQEMVCTATSWWLEQALRKLDAGGIERLDPRAPQRDCFVLRSILLSSYVRYSGYLDRIVGALSGHSGATAQLAHWKVALHASVDDVSRRQKLLQRLDEQLKHAAEVYSHLLASRDTDPDHHGE